MISPEIMLVIKVSNQIAITNTDVTLNCLSTEKLAGHQNRFWEAISPKSDGINKLLSWRQSWNGDDYQLDNIKYDNNLIIQDSDSFQPVMDLPMEDLKPLSKPIKCLKEMRKFVSDGSESGSMVHEGGIIGSIKGKPTSPLDEFVETTNQHHSLKMPQKRCGASGCMHWGRGTFKRPSGWDRMTIKRNGKRRNVNWAARLRKREWGKVSGGPIETYPPQKVSDPLETFSWDRISQKNTKVRRDKGASFRTDQQILDKATDDGKLINEDYGLIDPYDWYKVDHEGFVTNLSEQEMRPSSSNKQFVDLDSMQ